MKNIQEIKSIALCFLISGLLTFLLSFNAAAQGSAKTGSKKGVIVLKIKKEDNGKTTVTDTTFTITTSAGQKALEDYMKKHEEEFDKLSEELENIEVLVDIPDFPDSMASDSVIKKLRFIAKDIRCPHFRWQNRPEEFDYEFDFPCPPDVPPPPDVPLPPFPEYEGFDRECLPGHDMRVFRYENKKQTLSDIIGDIPMDRVKSYSIKDRKTGKRIIIDIEDAPLLENRDRVIIIREPGTPRHTRTHSDRQMKVIIKPDDDKQIEKPEEPPSPPPLPPPGKQDKPGGSTSTKPEI